VIVEHLAAAAQATDEATGSGSPAPDWRHKEALLHAFGLLAGHMGHSVDYVANAERLLKEYAGSELVSENPFMRARACWVYGQFGGFEFVEEGHFQAVCDRVWQNLSHTDLPVRVCAAIALINFLAHEEAVEFLRPALKQLITVFLKLIDEIDYDELIEALRTIVAVYGAEIAPYAVELC
jgi:hypothetical protein